jgi:hypothetical protein
MFIITSEKKSIRALSETNNSVEFHNQLFDTDDCVITEEPNEKFIEVKQKQEE